MAAKEQEGGKRRALGRGLESLLPRSPKPAAAEPAAPAKTAEAAQAGQALELAITAVDPNPFQTRKSVDEGALEELAASIRQVGVLQPILVRMRGTGRYELVAGQRRLLAAMRAGRLTVPAVVAALSDEQALEATIVENLQRADLSPMEQAHAFERLSREFHMTQEQIAIRTGKERATVANFLRLLRLPADLQEAVEKDLLSFGHARALLALETPEQMRRAAQRVQALAMSVRQTETFVKGILNPERRSQLRATSERVVDPNVREMEKTLRETLGLKVEIEDRHGRGKLTIAYATLEEFDGLMERLTGR